MKPHNMKAIVSGKTCENEDFTVECKFILIPPEDNNHYGTGYYMRVELPGDRHLVDVRYERTTNIEVLADRWIQGYFGKNAHKVVKKFEEAQ